MLRIANRYPVLVVVLVLATGLEARAGLDGDAVTIEQQNPTLGNVVRSADVVVEEGDGDAAVFGSQNATVVDVDPDAIRLTLGCDFPVCNRISSSAEFNGFVLTGLDWSSSPGPPVDLVVSAEGKFLDPARVTLLPGRIEINLARDVFTDGNVIRIVPVYAPQVAVDVVPGSDANVVSSRRGRIPVALLGSPDLDVRQVDPFSVRFGPADAPASWRFFFLFGWSFLERDVNRDGFHDLVFSFGARQAGIPLDATEACLSGEIDGLPFTACDDVQVRSRAR